MTKRAFALALPLLALAYGPSFATRYMTLEELQAQQATIGQPPPKLPLKLFLPVYREAVSRTAHFIASMQVSDSASANFGGVIEAENQTGIIQTDNTQEAIWVWSRYKQLFGADSFGTNIRRAWIYTRRYPAWREEGSGTDYYRDWNSGLGLFAESKYREVYGDSTYLHLYADSCISYLNGHPLNFNQTGYTVLHPFVTALYSGMLYHYWKDRGVQAYHDTAVARGTLVRNWIQASAQVRLQSNVWAMSGGTALWGVCASVLQEDTTAAKAWLATYVDSMTFFQATGTWNNSWNIYHAWAYRAAWEIGHVAQWQTNQKRLVDTLMAQDLDLDGGIPDTWNNGSGDGDASWTSSYLDFMGMDYWVEPSGEALETPVVALPSFSLGQSFPNPARGEAKLTFSLSRPAMVRFAIYNVAGGKVVTLLEGWRGAGAHQIRWSVSRNAGSGIYFYRLESEGKTLTGRMVLIR
jgi:hypothetical protein